MTSKGPFQPKAFYDSVFLMNITSLSSIFFKHLLLHLLSSMA